MTNQPLISHVSDTARWVAFYRAMESERPDAIFKDPYARRLAGPQGEAIVNAMQKGMRGDWPMIVRTAVMDEIVLRAVNEYGVTQVLNLAAGLDARPWRMSLPAALRWVDVDHPVMLDLKEHELAGERTSCVYEGVRLDLADDNARRALFARLAADGRKTLVVTEGLLIYLDEPSVRKLADDLAATKGFDLWLTDLASPGLIKMMEKSWGKAVAEGNAPFKFAPADSTAYFAASGWREREWRSQMEEGIRLNRVFPMAKFWRFIGRFMPAKRQEEFRRFSGISLLERVRG